jgi:thiamine biosynthesis protein ThiS
VAGLNIEVKFAGEVEQVRLADKSKVLDLLRELGINREVVAVKIGGKVVPEEETLKDGDRVEVFRIVSGG